MLEAMWSMNFVSNQQMAGSGIVVMEAGRVMGGDSSYMYRGTYEVVHGEVRANVKVTKYSPTLGSVFGDLSEFNLNLRGNPEPVDWTLSGDMVEDPSRKIAIHLTKQEDLP